MGSTAKIYFGCFIAVCIVVIFLLFSMQNSAQLKLDIQDVQRVVSEKEQQIIEIGKDLESARAAVQDTHAQDNLVAELKSNIQAKEQEIQDKEIEKQALSRQLAGFRTQLQNQKEIAEKRLAEISILQKQQQKDRQLFMKDDENKAAAEKQKAEFTAALRLTQEKIAKSEQSLRKVVETLEAKDRVIQMCETNLNKMKSNMIQIQDKDTYEKLNINLILDELAAKANIVEELTYRLEQAEKSISQEK